MRVAARRKHHINDSIWWVDQIRSHLIRSEKDRRTRMVIGHQVIT